MMLLATRPHLTLVVFRTVVPTLVEEGLCHSKEIKPFEKSALERLCMCGIKLMYVQRSYIVSNTLDYQLKCKRRCIFKRRVEHYDNTAC